MDLTVNLEDILLFIDTYKPSVFCLVETWLSRECPSSIFLPNDYFAVRWDREARGGGVALVLKKTLNSKIIPSPAGLSDIEACCVDIRTAGVTLRIIAYYRPGGTVIKHSSMLKIVFDAYSNYVTQKIQYA